MNAPDLTDNRLYRKYGVNGLQWFARTWFPFAYAVLVGFGFALFWLLGALPQRQSAFIGLAGLTALLAGLAMLTKMCREFRAGIRDIESRQGD